MRALIAGAGVGGLATGIALRSAGLEVKIFERSREMREIGAGLMIWPNGTRALEALGVEVRAMTIDRLFFRNWRGRLLIGADGLRSSVRRQLLADGDPVYLGASIWRGMVSSEGLPLKPGFGVNWIGRGSEFLAFHLADQRIYWAGVTKEPRGEKAGPGGHKQDALERFAAWEEDIPAVIAATEPNAILRNDM